MKRCGKLAAWLLAALVAVAASERCRTSASQAFAQVNDAQLAAHLAAGEFAPALAIARAAGTREQRDALLARVAVAQAQAGMRDAALTTAGELSDDQTRAQTLAQIGQVPIGGRGGGNEPDFDSLLNLIKSTIAPTTWDDVGGPGSVAPFPSGVYVDAKGTLLPLMKLDAEGRLASLRAAVAPPARPGDEDVRRNSPLRMVSLPRLEKRGQLLRAAGQPPTEAMQVLAGLQRIEYVFVYPESGDLVLAGPAGDWTVGPEQRIVSTQSGQPVVRLDDLVVIFRLMTGSADAKFGCLIAPTQEGLARLKAFVEKSNQHPIEPRQRDAWLAKLGSELGMQDIEVYGLDARTRAARVLVEADYRMKLVGMGLEPSVPGLESYLASIKLAPGEAPPPMGVLRWWFTLNYDAVVAAPDGRAFAIRGQGVKVLSENEHLTALGQRVHTGQSEELNARFAHGFTAHFAALCQKYPVYAELRNLCDLALVGALLRTRDLAAQTGWHALFFNDPRAMPVELAAAPKKVNTVVGSRVINRATIVAGVSGGVRVDALPLVAPHSLQADRDGAVAQQRAAAAPQTLPAGAWWWDAQPPRP